MESLNEQRLQALLQAPESKQLLEMLQKSHGDALRQAVMEIHNGNYAKVGSILEASINTEQAKNLANELKQRIG